MNKNKLLNILMAFVLVFPSLIAGELSLIHI